MCSASLMQGLQPPKQSSLSSRLLRKPGFGADGVTPVAELAGTAPPATGIVQSIAGRAGSRTEQR